MISELKTKKKESLYFKNFFLRIPHNALKDPFFISTFFLFVIYLVAWWPNTKYASFLYANGDGAFFAWLGKALVTWSRPFDILTFNPFAGMGSVFLPYSPWWNPAALALSLPFDPPTTYTISYSLYWFEAIVSIFLCARVIGLTKIESILSSQLFVLCFFPPFTSTTLTTTLIQLAPFFIHLMALCNIILFLFAKLGEGRWIRNFYFILMIIFCVFVLFMSSPFYAPIYAAAYAIIGFGVAFKNLNRRSLVWQGSAIISLAILALAFKVPEYYKVMADYSTRLVSEGPFILFSLPVSWPKCNFCNPNFYNVNTLGIFCSGNKSIMSYVYICALMGAVVSLFWHSGKHRAVASCFILASFLTDIFFFCTENSIIQGKISNFHPFYFVVATQLFFIIFFVLFFSFLWENFSKIWAFIHSNAFVRRFFSNSQLIRNFCWVSQFNIKTTNKFMLIIISTASLFLIQYVYRNNNYVHKKEELSASTDYLYNNISIEPESPFRGYTISYFVGPHSVLGKLNTLLNAYEIESKKNSFQHDQYVNARIYLGRDDRHSHAHIFFDLWKYNIPTLEEYAQTINRPMFLFVQNLLNFSTQKDKESHGLYIYDLDLRILRGLGVRFILTDSILNLEGLSFVLKQKPKCSKDCIKLNAVEASTKVYEQLNTSAEFQKLADDPENPSEIKSARFIDEFKKRLEQTLGAEFSSDKARITDLLAILLGIITKNKENISFSHLNELKRVFYGHLLSYVVPPDLNLYEIEYSNLATFSPTQPIHLDVAKEMFDLMKKTDFFFEKSVIVQDKNIPNNLVAAKNIQMNFKRNGVKVRAESDGWSIVLLPVQFSNCLRIVHDDLATSPENARLIRANFIQSALLFEGKVNTSINFEFNVNCRQKDVDFWKESQRPSTSP